MLPQHCLFLRRMEGSFERPRGDPAAVDGYHGKKGWDEGTAKPDVWDIIQKSVLVNHITNEWIDDLFINL